MKARLAQAAVIAVLCLIGRKAQAEDEPKWVFRPFQRGTTAAAGFGACLEADCATQGSILSVPLSLTPFGFVWMEHGAERARLALDLSGVIACRHSDPQKPTPTSWQGSGFGARLRLEFDALTLGALELSYVLDVGIDFRLFEEDEGATFRFHPVLTPGVGIRVGFLAGGGFLLPYHYCVRAAWLRAAVLFGASTGDGTPGTGAATRSECGRWRDGR